MYSSSTKIYPNMVLHNPKTGRNFRLSLIVVDRDDVKWGLTSRHAFHECDTTAVLDSEGGIVGDFSKGDAFDFRNAHDISAHIALIRLSPEINWHNQASFDRFWPSGFADPNVMLGQDVFNVEHMTTVAGSVVEVNASVAMKHSQLGQTTMVSGACVIHVDQDDLLGPDPGGALFTSQDGDAVGLTVARVQKGHDLQVVLAPLAKLVEGQILRVWAPPFSHWSDIYDRVRLFKRKILDTRIPDFALGHRQERNADV